MAWTPTLAVIKTRGVAANLLAYITDGTRQTDAYTWAGDAALRTIKTVSNSVASRTTPFYPAIAFSDDNDAQDFTNDIINAAYSCIFEVSIQNADPDAAVVQARKYAAAIASMIVNCPKATLTANTGAVDASLNTIETGFEPIKTNEMQNDFLQVFQIRVTFTLYAEYLT